MQKERGNIVVALDGPSGAGKSTVAKEVARRLGLVYIDTGALYRAVGLYLTRKGVDVTDAAAVEPELKNIDVRLEHRGGEQRVLLNGEDVSQEIRRHEISRAASDCSAIPAVRGFLLSLQRKTAERESVIMDGRDIGTVVLPGARVKIFLSAKPEIRARRRYLELVEKGQQVDYESVLKDLIERDYNDSHRSAAPLKQAEDAVLLDGSSLNFEQVVQKAIDIINAKLV